jgi:glycosyltransferase involved in cell wall biosynthesis
MARVVMFVLNDVRADTRVLREAASLAAAGHAVTVIGRPTDLTSAAVERETRDGVEIVRVPVPGTFRRRLLEAGAGRGATTAPASPPSTRRPSVLRGLVRAGRGGRRLPVAGSIVDGLDWLTRWRFGVRAWGRAAAAAAPAADVWHAHDLTALPAALEARRRRGGRVVYDSHELFLEAGWSAARPGWAKAVLRRFERSAVASVDAVVTVNDALAEVLTHEYAPRRIVVVHNCPPRRDATPRDGSPLRTAIGVGADVPVALLHGSLAHHRGVDVLLSALREPELERVHAAFLGSGSDRALAVNALSDPVLAGRVHVLDPVEPSAVVDWVAGADVGVMPIAPSTLNHRLSTPNKLFESLAAGVPVVASDFAAIRPIVEGPDGPLGRLVDPGSPAAVAAAIAAIIGAPPEDRAALRERCLAAAHRRWNWETEGAKLLGLYEDLVGAADASGSTPADRPPRVTFVLPTSGRFDSRTRRLAVGLHARSHEVRVLAREESVGGELPVELVPGVPLVTVSADPADGLPHVLPASVRQRVGRALATAEARARDGRRRSGPLTRVAGEGLRILAVAVRARAQAAAVVRADAGADVYHAMGFLALPVALRLAREHAGARVIYDARDVYAESNNIARLPTPLRALFARRERLWARRADAILTVNDGVADLLAARWDVERPTVVMNCSPAWTPPDPPPDLLRRALDLPSGSPVALYHGGFMPDRGLPELVAAMRRPGLEQAHLVLLGSGALEPELRRLAAEPESGGRVHVLPPVRPEDLLPWVASADVGVMPNQPRTLNERLSTPNKLFECLAAGLPVVSSDFPERRRIILLDPDGPLGAVCDPTDPDAIAAAIRSILDLPSRERAVLRARVLRVGHVRYTWEPQFDAAVGTYDRLGGGR